MEQLKLLMDEGINFTGYSGWFEFEKENEEMTDDDIIWAGNVEDRKGTKFGLVKDGLFKIVEKNKKNIYFQSLGLRVHQIDLKSLEKKKVLKKRKIQKKLYY